VNQWNDEGQSLFNCADCAPHKKRLFGCGYDENRGCGRLRESKGIDAKGVCPGWWRNSEIVDDVLMMRDYRANLGHPLHIPQRLIECIKYLENQEIIAQNNRLEKMRDK